MHFFKDINKRQFAMYDKTIVKKKIWAALPLASKAVYPVLCLYADEKGIAWPSQITVAILSGLSVKSVATGIRGLQSIPGFSITHYVNGHGKRAYRYKLPLASKEKGAAFPFHRAILDGGHWFKAGEAAKALYPVMRAFSYFDHQEVCSNNDDAGDFVSDYTGRRYEFCEAETNILKEYSGLCRRAVYNGLESLEEDALLIKRESGIWKIYLRPETFWKASHLNDLVAKSYKSEISKCAPITDNGVHEASIRGLVDVH